MNKRINSFFLAAAILIFPIFFTACADSSDSKYADPENWAYYEEGSEKAADVFLYAQL